MVLGQKLVFWGYEQWIFLFVERENGPFFDSKIGFKANLTKNLAQKLGHFWGKVAYFDPNFDFLAKSRFSLYFRVQTISQICEGALTL